MRGKMEFWKKKAALFAGFNRVLYILKKRISCLSLYVHEQTCDVLLTCFNGFFSQLPIEESTAVSKRMYKDLFGHAVQKMEGYKICLG